MQLGLFIVCPAPILDQVDLVEKAGGAVSRGVEVLLENRLALVFRQLDVIQRNADRRLRVVLIGIHRQPAVSGQGIAVLLRPFLRLRVIPVPDFIRDFSTACFHLQAVPGI